MAIIRMGYPDQLAPGQLIEGAYTPVRWCNDKPVMDGNSEVALRDCRHGAMFLYETHHGLCIREREMNGYDDSDFYMLIWDEAAQAPFEIMFATTRGWSYPCYGSRPDATPEVMEAYNAWAERDAQRYAAKLAKAHTLTTIANLNCAHKGATVRVARGRKVPKGTIGRVMNISEQRGYTGELERWALIDTGSSFVKVLAAHLDVITPDAAFAQEVFDLAC